MSFVVGTSTKELLVYVLAGAGTCVLLRINADKITPVGSFISSI